jgi:hypothetical protein
MTGQPFSRYRGCEVCKRTCQGIKKRHEETVEITPLAPLGERVTRTAVRRAQAIG